MGTVPILPEKIPIEDLSTEVGQTTFRTHMHDKGYVCFTLNESLSQGISDYLEAVKIYFSQNLEVKLRLSSSTKLMKINEGYLIVEGIKEYLKLKHDGLPGPEFFPGQEDFLMKFENCFEQLHKLGQDCFTILGSTVTPPGQYINQDLQSSVKDYTKRRSSISVIRYFPRGPPSERVPVPGYDEDENGMTIPSKSHMDTGILTFILCSDVPGLQVENRDNHQWIPVESLNTPKKDLFCIMGRKIEILAADSKHQDTFYKATVHRVVLPYNVERYSILFFLDVPN